MVWLPATPQTCSVVMSGFVTMSLNHGPHQWCSCPRMMTKVWICYPTVLWALHEAWTTSDRGGSPHRPHHDLQLHPRYAQLFSWILDQRTKSFDYAYHQWCGGPIMMTQVWIRYASVLWVLYETCTTPGRGKSPHRLHHDLQIHARHTQLSPWILELRFWTMDII